MLMNLKKCLGKLGLKIKFRRGAWVALSVTRLDLSSGHDLMVCSSSPTSGSVLTAQSLEPVSDSVSPSVSLPFPCSRSVSLSKTNIKKNISTVTVAASPESL